MPRYRSYDHISIRAQAEQAADFYLAQSPRPIHVFPCKRTGHSVEFRSHLAAIIAFGSIENRKLNEQHCAEMGYPFIEVDPADYPPVIPYHVTLIGGPAA